MKETVIMIIFLVQIISCQNKESKPKNNIIIKNIEKKQENDYLKSELYNCICSYMHTSGMYFSTEWTTCINIYFFQQDTIDYFTIWTDGLSSQYLCFENSNRNLDISQLKIDLHSCDVSNKLQFAGIDSCYMFFIKQTDYDNDLYKSFSDMFRNDVYIEDNEINNDGRLFLQTYKFYKTGNEFHFEKLDKPIVDFLGNLNERFW
jgi:hypothetical protein